MFSILSTALAAIPLASALTPVTVSGNAFYNGTSDRFYIRGVDYQPGGSSLLSDPLADSESCMRDIPYFQELGVNTIRVYTVDNKANHDACMNALEDAGIYLILDVNTPHQSLNRYNTTTLQLSYNSGYLQHVFATIDAFKSYNNTLGFFAANEVINSDNNTIAAPYIKAVVRDMKEYISKQSSRTIPVGYSAADIATNRWQQMSYLNCGNDSVRIDMFGMNDYSWCGTASSYTVSGWSRNVANYTGYSIPLFLSEYGCNTVRPRTFPEISALYSEEMCKVYSGGLVYEYSNESNNYGLVSITGNNSVSTLDDFDNFKSALADAPAPTGIDGAANLPASDCPAFESGVWEVDPDTQIPAMPSYALRYMSDGAGEPLGMNGTDTQNGSYNDIPDDSSSSSASFSSQTNGTWTSQSTQTSTSSTSSGHTTITAATTTSSSSSSSSSSKSTKTSKSKNAASGRATGSFVACVLALLAYI